MVFISKLRLSLNKHEGFARAACVFLTRVPLFFTGKCGSISYNRWKQKLGTETLDTQLQYCIRLYCHGAVGMTREWLLKDNITPAETVVRLMIHAMPEALRRVYFPDENGATRHTAKQKPDQENWQAGQRWKPDQSGFECPFGCFPNKSQLQFHYLAFLKDDWRPLLFFHW